METSNIRILVNIETGDLAVEESVTGTVNELIYGKEITSQQKLDKYAGSDQINLKDIIECYLATPDNFDENFYCKIHRRILDCVDTKNSRIESIDRLKHLMGDHFIRMNNDEFISKTRNYFREGQYAIHVDIKDGDMIFSMK